MNESNRDDEDEDEEEEERRASATGRLKRKAVREDCQVGRVPNFVEMKAKGDGWVVAPAATPIHEDM